MANETWKFVQAKSKQAMKQVLGIRDEKTRMKVTLPLAMAPVTQDDDMRWNPKQRLTHISLGSLNDNAVQLCNSRSSSCALCANGGTK